MPRTRALLAAVIVIITAACESTTEPTINHLTGPDFTAGTFWAIKADRTRMLTAEGLGEDGGHTQIYLSPATVFSGDATTIDQLIDLARAGFRVTFTITGTWLTKGYAFAATTILVTNGGALKVEHVTVSSRDGVFVWTDEFPRIGIGPTKTSIAFPEWATVLANSELPSVASALAAVQNGERICFAGDAYRFDEPEFRPIYQYKTIGAWHENGDPYACVSR